MCDFRHQEMSIWTVNFLWVTWCIFKLLTAPLVSCGFVYLQNLMTFETIRLKHIEYYVSKSRQDKLESSHSMQVPPPRQCYSPGGVTIFALPAVPLCPLWHIGNENFKVIQNPGFLPDHPQNWITGGLCHARHTLKISERSIHNFLSYLADTQTNKQTKKQTNKNRQKHYLLGGGKIQHFA